ncbi:MAG: FAD-dependent oxidoreductase, partial [Leptospiraceae bacterium]|nr:FAD-dependent oxidoreductase [Leptospiraceae bacterium]
NTCIACNQACLDHAFLEKDVSCVVNPRAVRELDYPVDKRDSKRVVVIGSGPAGLEAARAAAEIGHKVILIEKDSEIGGQLIMAAKIPGKFEFLETIRYYKNELKDLNVDIRLNTECTLDLLKELNSDAIIFATGVKPREVNIDGLEKVHHVTYSDFLKGKNKVGEKVVIIGGGGIAVDIAHLLTAHGEDLESYFKRYKIDTYNKIGIEKQSSSKDITIFKRSGKVGAGLGQTTFWALKQELENTGVKFITGLKYKEVKESNLVYEDNKSGELNSTVVDTIILCAGQESENKLAEECKNVMPDKKVIVVGGAKNSSGIDAKRAFQEGLDAAYSI